MIEDKMKVRSFLYSTKMAKPDKCPGFAQRSPQIRDESTITAVRKYSDPLRLYTELCLYWLRNIHDLLESAWQSAEEDFQSKNVQHRPA